MATWEEIEGELAEDDALDQSAAQYLNEVNQLTEMLARCNAKLMVERETQETYRSILVKEKLEIERVNKKIDANQRKMNSLKSRLNHVLTSDRNALHLPSQVDPDLITFQARKLLKEIEQDSQEAQRTGTYEGINARIAEVRKLFDLCLIQFDSLNQQNKMVTGTLDCLISLDRTEEFLRSLKLKYTRNIPTIKIN